MKPNITSWGAQAEWYEDLLKEPGTHQSEVILPNLLRLVDPRRGEVLADIGCGTGFFAKEFAKKGAGVFGIDVAKELIALAKQGAGANLTFFTANSSRMPMLKSQSVDKAVIVLALQNMADLEGTLKEAARILKPQGRLFLVLNHPAFRVPKKTFWGWDEKSQIQYRRIDGYLSESKEKIQMHPGADPRSLTISFHRPLQVYAKALKKSGFEITGMEEWISRKKSRSGLRSAAEDRARKEIPLFLYLEARKVGVDF